MKWVYAALTGLVMGWVVFVPVWAILANTVGNPAERKIPPRPVAWAMSIAFIAIALSWAGFFREVAPLPAPDEYEQDRG
jgi:hypothetical protein